MAVFALLFALLSLSAFPSGAAAEPVPLSASAYANELAGAQRLVAACALTGAACDASAIPVDADVARAGGTTFRASWLWLREALAVAKGASPQERGNSMRLAAQHLVECAAEANSPRQEGAAELPQAQAAAARILARAEFQAGPGPTWIDRKMARVQDWFLRILLGVSRLGAGNPWLAPLLEWICFLGAAGGLLLFVRQSLSRQTLRLSLGGSAAAAQGDSGQVADWARLAEESAAGERWREALHHLYWAAILSLETRRAWRPNPTRTPREYLLLLPSGSPAQRTLRELTRSLERVWYGHGEGTAPEFQAAKARLAEIQAADPTAGPRDVERRAARTPSVGAT